MTLREFEDNLKAACSGLVYELSAPKAKNRYVVWHRYGGNSTYGDNRNVLDAPKVQIDIVTQSAQDPLVDDVMAALWSMDLPYSIESEGYDPDYNAQRTILQLVVI